jgi:integrase
VALSAIGRDALRQHRKQQDKQRMRMGESWEDNNLGFPNAWGRFMATDYFVRREFGRILERAGLPRIRFHDLRHTFATLQLGNQQPIKVVSEMMGHSRTAITQDLYTHVSAHSATGSRGSGRGAAHQRW